ncbi:UBX domain-containing protein 2A [Heteronotia binoei]|uniref:UBX domain-containing protein 2A n=1 Tax=Heteronotia binoei TaxID=13085 RepID=UPI00293060D0|nr:UBX domain-containing protein 2A [Heteronotia binoei]XP_060114061.1 UBX domain-containing protein 2A [Heteronotia binoei]
MQEVNKIGSVKQEWLCKPRTNDQILNETQQKGCDIFDNDLFEEAQKVGAGCTEETRVKHQADTTIKLWKNGFTVNDGELLSYTEAANQRFLESIKKGQLPLELQKIFDKEEVDVKVHDKKDEVYMLKKPVFHAFTGQGYRLGSATPRIISKAKQCVQETEKRRPTVLLNTSEPITSVQIWLADGTRIVQKFNVTHKISHIRDFIINYPGAHGRSPFTLTTSLPFRELLDESLTLEEASLKNAVVVQRLKKSTEPFRNTS